MSDWTGYKQGNTYKASQLAKALKEAFEEQEVDIIQTKETQYFNVPASFDIETTSFIAANNEDGEPIKAATMYIWQMGFNGTVVYGRTWDEWFDCLEELIDYLQLSERRRLIIYVHNLGYEFQFIRNYFEWDKVFAIKQRRPVYAIYQGLEFRCSYFLSNYSLAYIGDNLLHKYPIKKLVGDLDYSKIRHSETVLTDKELDYCINDVKVVMYYIQEKIEHDGDITKIPLTNTGYVRNYCRKECFFEGIDESNELERKRTLMDYRAIMKSLQIQTKDEYEQMQKAFMGGFTHASALYSGKVMDDVGSADETSAYPAVMVTEYFPMSKGEFIGTVEDDRLFSYYLSKYCCLFDIQFLNLKPKVEFENILSQSRCIITGKSIINNGRVVSAENLITTITELDYDAIQKFYTWDYIKVFNMRIYTRGFLPRALILSVLDLYGDKTTLKGIEGKEVEYLVSKNMINASFGMMVTAVIRDEYEYTDEWLRTEADVDSQLAAYNTNFNRFLYYGWGVWVTAHARHNLFSAIYEFGNDYIYSDTDSIKGINFDDHLEYFKNYNNNMINKLLTVCNHYKIPFSKCTPKTKKGETKILGVWEREEGYLRFKTVGAKRYMYENLNGEMGMTVSGLNKNFALPWLLEDNNNNHDVIFEKFGEGLFIPEKHTGKNTLTYIEDEMAGTLVDYLGKKAKWHEMSSIHMEPQAYFMSLIGDYIKYLEGVQHVEY